MKRIFAITFLNYFVSGGLALTIPLLLLERNVNLAEIGIVVSILPLVFLAVRLLFAVFADQLGWAPFYLLLNWPGTVISTLIYFLATSISGFLLGKIVEAVKESAYWAVNRTAIFSLSPTQREKEATRNSGVISLSFALGSAVSGLGIAYMGFSSTLGIFIIASTIMGVPAALLWHTEKSGEKLETRNTISSLDPRGRSKTFWLVSLTMLLYSLAFHPLMALLLPIFMNNQLGYDYALIGVAFMLYNMIASSITLSTLRIPLGFGRVVIQSLIALSATVLLANSGTYFPVFFFALALAQGLGAGFFESIIAKAARNRTAISIDIGLLHIPMRLAEFASVLGAGFVVQSMGYTPIFTASGFFFMAFSVLSLYVLRTRNS